MKCIAAKFVHRLFTNDQKQPGINSCNVLEEQLEVDLDLHFGGHHE